MPISRLQDRSRMPRRLPTGRVGARGCTTIIVILGLACSCVRVQAREKSLKRSLLFLNMRGNTLMAISTGGKNKTHINLASIATTKVLPGAVSADGLLAFNPASLGNAHKPYVMVTDLATGRVNRVTVPPVAVAGRILPLTGCTFAALKSFNNFGGLYIPFAGMRMEKEGTYIAAGALSSLSGTYTLSYLQACSGSQYIVKASYGSGKVFLSTLPKHTPHPRGRNPLGQAAAHVCVQIKQNEVAIFVRKSPFNYDTSYRMRAQDPRLFASGNMTAITLTISKDYTYIIGTVYNGEISEAGTYGSAGVFEAVSADAGLIRIGGLQPEFDLDAARLCLNFVLVSTLGSNKLAASCVLQKKPATWQSVFRSGRGTAVTSNSAKHVQASNMAMSFSDFRLRGGYESLVSVGENTLFAITTPPQGSRLATVREIRMFGANTALRQRALFQLPSGYGSLLHVP